MVETCEHVFYPYAGSTSVYRCDRCPMLADLQPDGSLLARGKIKSINVSVTLGGAEFMARSIAAVTETLKQTLGGSAQALKIHHEIQLARFGREPDYGVDMSPYLKTPGFGKALKDALSNILPPDIPIDEAMAAMGYVREDSYVPRHKLDATERICIQRGDELQIAKDEKREVEAENSRLRRKVEALERRK